MKKQGKYSDFFAAAGKVMSPSSVKRAEAKAKKGLLKLRLSELRHQVKLKQTEVPGFSQASISRIEGRQDVKLSTLVDYVHALGMDLEIRAIRRKASPRATREIVLLKQ